MAEGEEVEVETGNSHDGIVGVALILHSVVGEGVPGEGEIIVSGVEGFEERGRSSEEGDILNVRVVFLFCD